MRNELKPGRHSQLPTGTAASRRAFRRRRAVTMVALLLAAAGLLTFLLLPRAGGGAAESQGFVTLSVPGEGGLRLPEGRARQIARGLRPLPVPSERILARGEAKITYRLDRQGARRDLAVRAAAGGEVSVGERPVAAVIKAPVVTQIYPNNCETAALQILLATRGVERSQRTLQRQLRRDGPLDPRTSSDGSKVWGDPRYGFVGRVEGGGVAGGFGVLRETASRAGRPVGRRGRSHRGEAGEDLPTHPLRTRGAGLDRALGRAV